VRSSIENSSQIVPRWEWRTFSENGEYLKHFFAQFNPQQRGKSEETYILVPQGELNAKIRNQIFDVKQKLKVNSHGLEQWLPILKLEFPMPAEDFEKAAKLLRLKGPSPEGSLTESDFIVAVGLESKILPIRLMKMRAKYDFQGVVGEFTQLQIGTRDLFTIAIEHVDTTKIDQIRKQLGLDDLMNESYPQALKRLLGIEKGVS